MIHANRKWYRKKQMHFCRTQNKSHIWTSKRSSLSDMAVFLLVKQLPKTYSIHWIAKNDLVHQKQVIQCTMVPICKVWKRCNAMHHSWMDWTKKHAIQIANFASELPLTAFFLAVQDSSISDIVCLSVCRSQLTIRAYNHCNHYNHYNHYKHYNHYRDSDLDCERSGEFVT